MTLISWTLDVGNHEDERNDEHTSIEHLIAGARAILHSPDSFPISKSFISGVTDADRIDFVRRDTHFSGLLHSSVDYGRLFGFFQLQKVKLTLKSGAQSEVYVAAPSSRAHSDAEKLLWERLQDYKYIACHHRVHLNDELLERCIIELACIGKLSSVFGCMLGISRMSDLKPNDFRALHKQLAYMTALLTEFDDAWLEMQFRSVYKNVITDQATGLDERAHRMLSAYVEGTAGLESAFHSDHDFWEFAKKHYPSLCDLRIRRDGDSENRPADVEIRRRTSLLKNLTSTVNQNKHTWETLLFTEYKMLVVIGEVSNKLKPGFGPLRGFESLHEFLSEKITDTMPFNFWYPKEGGESLKLSTFNYIRDAIAAPVDFPTET